MSADYSYARASARASVNAGTNTREKIKSPLKIEKGIKRMLIIAAILLTAQLVWLFVISPFIPFTTIEVHGFSGFEKAEILSVAGVDETTSFVTLDAISARNNLASHYLVEDAKVIKRFPDRLMIFVESRTAVAVSLMPFGGGTLPLYMDRYGVIFKIGNMTADAGDINLPILSGLEFEYPQLGMRLPESFIPMLHSIYKIAHDSPELLSAISEIRVEKKAWDGFDLIVYPVYGSTKVRLENNLTEEDIRYMLLMLNVFENRSGKPQEVDFRSGMGSYKMKEPFL